MENIIKHYEEYDEDSRLVKDNAHRIEFITTVHYLDKYINSDSKILEVGAGTGRYSLYFAEKGCDVTALDLTPRHIDIIREKAEVSDIKIDAKVGNALNLSPFEKESFDFVLCLGPLYHLFNEEDRGVCIEECLRVLKKGGILAVAYINRCATFVNMVNRDKKNIYDEGLLNIVKMGLEFGDKRDCFYHSSYREIEAFMKNFNIRKIKNLASDGIGGTLRNNLREFDEKEFQKWMDFHLITCEDESLIGYSQHGLYLCEKI